MIYYTENFNCSNQDNFVSIPSRIRRLFLTQINHFSKVYEVNNDELIIFPPF